MSSTACGCVFSERKESERERELQGMGESYIFSLKCVRISMVNLRTKLLLSLEPIDIQNHGFN